MTHPYQRDRRLRRLEAYSRAQVRRQPNPRYHDPRLAALTVGELEALEGWFTDHPNEPMPATTLNEIVTAYREGVR